MHQFRDCAIARFVASGSEHVAPVVLSHQQNAILRPGCCKRGSCHRQERTCWETSIVSSQAEPMVFRAQVNFARQFVAAPADVLSLPSRIESKLRQQRGQSLTTTNYRDLL